MTHQLVVDLIIVLAAGFIAGLVCKAVRLPTLIGYMVAGLIVGPGGLRWIAEGSGELEHIAELGVFLLLFAIGLEFSLDEMQRLGWRFIVGGGTQMLLVALPVAFGALQIGYGWRAALLLATASAFSSTVLVFRSLAEFGQAAQPHGSRAIGILLFQDAALVPLLLVVPILTGHAERVPAADYLLMMAKSSLFIVGIVALRFANARYGVALVAAYRSLDLIVLFTLASIASITATAYWMGLPPALGAFAAGLVFNGNRWASQIDAIVLPLRESSAAVFFVSLGVLLEPSLIYEHPFTSAGMLGVLIALKALATTVALRLTGLGWRESSGMGMGLAHIGEFALVLVLAGSDAGLVSDDLAKGFLTLAILSLIVAPLLLRVGLRFMRNQTAEGVLAVSAPRSFATSEKAIVIGAGPTGRRIASQLEIQGHDVCVVDLSPLNLNVFSQQGFRTVLGDASERSTLEVAGIAECSLLVLSVTDDMMALRIARAVRAVNRRLWLLVRCRYHSTLPALKNAGADQIVSEELQASNALVDMLAEMATNKTPTLSPDRDAKVR
ncbi:MAG: cation:proton antiporter [Planctomycetales bacterium]|nr:cation:proton antiporter [Planctomycetales bacterium]